MPTTNSPPTSVPPVLIYARLLRETHDLIAQGCGDTDEADALADRMEAPWYAMTPQEQERMRGLSTDLHGLRSGGPERVEMSPEQLTAWQAAAQAACTRLEAGDADAALAFLRRPVPSPLPPPLVPLLQAKCWEKLGDPETARVFRREAERLAPSPTPSGGVAEWPALVQLLCGAGPSHG